jgi:RNA polymerase sigma-54 factor
MPHSQIQVQNQEQSLKQTQIFSQQQLLQAQLVELPVTQLMERVRAEMDDNPALEIATSDDVSEWKSEETSDDIALREEDFVSQHEREERQSALDEALAGIGRDDEELPVYHGGMSNQEEREEMVYGETASFYDLLKEQMGEIELSPREADIMEYLIGSLDDDGLLRKSTDSICDELAIYHNIEVTHAEIEQILRKLQDFDPAGIGARSLQECLLLQIRRREDSRLRELMEKVINRHFDEFTKKHWDKIQQALGLSDIQADALMVELRKLNPKPGASLGESVGRSMQQITPDFIVDTQDDGTVTFHLNNGEVPELYVSQSFADTLKEYQNNRDNMSRQMKEALLYTKKKVDAAQGFIEAIRMRRHTLSETMKAIILIQHRFFEDGDEASLRPMILKDVAERTGLDLSTISRVCNSKYAQTRWGVFPLRYFFSDSYVTESGEELSTRRIKVALRDIVEGEDKKRPLSDDDIKIELTRQGFPIARRTVAKYREQLGIPIARLRRV